MRRLLTILILLTLTSCKGTSLLDSSSRNIPQTFSIGAARVSLQELPLNVQAPALTIPYESVEIKQTGQAKILEIPVEEGQEIHAGDVLVRYDDTQMRLRLDLARAEIREAETTMATLNQMNQSRDRLLESEKIIKEEYDMLESRIQQYEAKLERAKAEAAWLEIASQDTTLASPIEGLVSAKHFTSGALPEDGASILKVVRIDPVKVEIQLPQNYLSAITRDTPTTVHFDVIQDREFPVQIILIGPELGPEGRSFVVRGTISNTDRLLKPGLSGEALLNTNYRTETFLIPPEAIFSEGDKDYIYRIVDNVAKKTRITKGDMLNNKQGILKGVKRDDWVATSHLSELYDNALVEITSRR